MALDASRRVTAIVTNWKRPGNVEAIVTALNRQSVRPNVVLVDNSELGKFAAGLLQIGEYWRFPDRGIVSRFAPALLDLTSEYTLFLDDDLLPGPRCVENLLSVAQNLYGHFSTIGQIGRIYHRVTNAGLAYEYKRRNAKIPQDESRAKVDLTCRAHFVRTSYLQESIKRLSHVSRVVGPAIARRHDDICLCQSIQRETGHPSYIVRVTPETALRAQDLPDGSVGASAAGSWTEDRTKLIDAFAGMGWRSLV